jgi:large subunit ribosomal protein L7/L12
MATQKLTKEDFLTGVKNMTVVELAELIEAMEDEFNVSAAAPAVVGVAPGAAVPGADAAAQEEKTEFSVFITAIGDKKIQVIKEVRAATSLGLKEAKELVEGMSKPVVENVDKETADGVKAKLEEAGATTEVK